MVCVSVSFQKVLAALWDMHSIREAVYWGVEVGVAQLGNSISVSSVVVSQWVLFEYVGVVFVSRSCHSGFCVYTRVIKFLSPFLFPNQWVCG